MKFKKVIDSTGTLHPAVKLDGSWKIIETDAPLLHFLGKDRSEISQNNLSDFDSSKFKAVLPFRPMAYRDFMLYEQHAIDAARGFVKKYMPKLLPVVRIYERILGPPFPKLKPGKRYYQHPIYYLGNHLNFITHGDSISIPAYSKELDYELEIGAIITKPLKNARVEEVNQAIGGFVILNDFSARDVQLSEIRSGFGPMKAKNFGTAMSSVIVNRDELIDRLEDLKVKVTINGKEIVKSSTKGKKYSFAEAIAYASWEEQLHPGEIFGSGTVTGCAGIENGHLLNQGDQIKFEVEGIGELENHIV